MRYASGFRNPTRVLCIKFLVFVLALAPAAELTVPEEAAAQAQVNLAIEPASIDENGGPQVLTFRATVPAASNVPLVIVLSPVLEQSTATIPDDLVAPLDDQAIIILQGQTEGVLEVTVTPTDDDIYEGTETFVIQGVRINSEPLTMPISLEIIDDESAPTFTLSATPDMLDEGGGPQQVTMRATATVASSVPTVIALAPVLEQSTATIPDDLVASPLDQPIIIPAGQTEGVLEVTVTPTDDDIHEGTETFVVQGVGGDGESLTMPVSLEIIDNEQAPTFTLSTTPDILDEGGGPQQVTIRAAATVASPVPTVIALAPVPEQSTATIPDDLVASPLDQPIVIAAGQTEGVLVVTVIPKDDDIYEGTETFVVLGVGGDGQPLTMPVSLEIIDDETVPAITLSATPDMVDEGGGPQVGVVTATASRLSAMDLQVSLVPLLQQSTATLIGPGADLGVPELASNPNVVITIPAGQSAGSINLTVVPVDDDVYETDEYAVFVANLMGTISEPVAITIVDDDAPEIVLSGVPAALGEDGGAQTVTFEVELSGSAVPIPTVITLEMTGTATQKTDYEWDGTAEIVIPAGGTSGSTQLTYTVVNDEVYEPNGETIVVSATWNGSEIGSVTLTIADNFPAPAVTAAIPDLALKVGDSRQVDVSASFSGRALAFSASSSDDAVSADMLGTILSVTANRSGSARVTVVATNEAGTDSLDFGVTVTAVGGEWKLAIEPSSVDENGGPQQVTIRATATVASSVPTVIVLAPVLEQSTAVFPDDLVASPLDQPIVIAPGQTEGVLVVTVIPTDDDIYEGTETFVVQGVGIDGEPLTMPVALEIIDDDPVPAVTLSATPDMIDEGGGPQVGVVTATVSGPSATDLHVILVPLLQQSTATLIGPGADIAVQELALGSNVVITVPAGQSTGSINLTIVPVDDEIYETDEYVVLAGNLMGTNSDPVVITVVDNDVPDISLSGVPAVLREDAGAQAVSFTASLSGPPVPIPTVIALDMTGTATQGTDYAWDGTAEIVIPPGETSAGTQLTYTVADDEVYEPNDETIVVTARWGLSDLGVVTLTITDNYGAPAVVSPVSDVILIAGGTFEADVASSFSGKDLTYSVSASGNAVSADIMGTSLVVTANRLGTGRVTVAATNAVGSVSYNFGVSVTASFTLSATPVALREDGGAQTVSFTASLSGTAVSFPTAITLDMAGTATEGTDYVANGDREIVIPAGGNSATAELVFAVTDDEVYEPNDETIVVSANWNGNEIDSVTLTIADNFPAPEVTGVISDMTLEAGDARQADVSASFQGKVLTFSASSSSDDVASAEISGSTLSVTANGKGSARVTVVATNDAGSVSLDFGVTVTTVAQERMVYTDILAAMGRGMLSSVSNTIGGRFSLTAAERQLAVGNRRVDGMASGLKAMIGLTGTRETGKYGMADDAGDRNGPRPVSARELVRGTSFSYALDDYAPDDAPQFGTFDRLSYTIWGSGDWNAFEGSASQAATFDGSLVSGYLGLDVSKTGRWMAGVAVGRTMGTSDYDVTITDGTLETTLNSVFPYVLWNEPGWGMEFWGIGGFGTGEVKADDMASDLSMRLFLIGTRSQLAGSVADGPDLDVVGDVGIASLSTAAGESTAVDDLEAGVHRVRLGLEGSLSTSMDNGMFVTPFVQVAGRIDGGDGQTGAGLEITGGVHIEAGRAGVEARGRLLAAHSGEEVSERGFSLAAFVKPSYANGQGFSMTVVPRLGADTDMSGDIWREEPVEGLARSSRSGAGMKAEMGYGLVHPAMSHILVTPFGAVDVVGDDRRRMRLGARFGSSGHGAGVLSFELSGERIERYGRTPDHRIGLLGRMSF